MPHLGGNNLLLLGRAGGGAERLLKVGDDVVNVLDADRDSDKVLQ